MADKRITELNLHTSLELSDVLPIVNSSETKKTTYGTLYYRIRDGVISGSSQITLGDTNGFSSFSSSLNDTFVPYIGATTDVDLGNNDFIAHGIKTEGAEDFPIIKLGDYGGIENGTRIIIDNPTSTILMSAQNGVTTNGNQTITGSLFVSETTELGGDIFPKTPQGATLGTIDKPFADLFLQSGSISIESDTPGNPSAIISNNFGNLEISVGGMLLVESDSSFIAPTGSFDKMSADLTENYVWLGDSNNRNTQVSLDTLADSGSLVQSAYISLYSTQSQQLVQSGSAQAVTFSNIWTQKGVSLVSGSQIVMEKAGTYQFNFVAQLTNTQNAVHDSYFWIKYNGNNFPNSATQMSLQPRKNDSTPSAQLMTVNIVGVAQNDGDYIELYWTGDSDTIKLSETPGDGVKPETPSVIANIVRVG